MGPINRAHIDQGGPAFQGKSEAARHAMYSVGDTIEASCWGGGSRIVVIETKDASIKNGRPGWSGSYQDKPDSEFGTWGYDDQIIRVVQRGGE